jgi:asparagine synthase (glutamine-hydrolysing)
MWALAIWNSHYCRLFLARDRMGEKPQLIVQDGSRFLFALEQKALLPFLVDVQPSLRFHALYRCGSSCLCFSDARN